MRRSTEHSRPVDSPPTQTGTKPRTKVRVPKLWSTREGITFAASNVPSIQLIWKEYRRVRLRMNFNRTGRS